MSIAKFCVDRAKADEAEPRLNVTKKKSIPER